MSKILENLNEKQLKAVTHYLGPVLVVAGAGSGKTRALTHRIAYLIKEKGINPWNILAVTFTNKAANEMKKRVIELLARQDDVEVIEGTMDVLSAGEFDKMHQQDLPTIGTFHSVCVRILRKNIHLLGFSNSFAIYDATDQKILMKRIMDTMMIDTKKVNPKAVLGHISNAKNQLIGPEKYQQFINSYFTERVAEIYPVYQRSLAQNSALDFDDIIMKTVELFEKFPDILEKYQEKFKFISVDEYQDTNRAQYVLIKMLAQKYQNLCAIGDSDQSIYSWRGATLQNLLDFERDYPDCLVVMLEQNYRSTQLILDASNQIISKNKQRREKQLWTDRDGGDNISHWVADNERHEGQLIAKEILAQLKDREFPNYNDFVVLYRTNAQSRVIEETFLRHGLPYRIVGGIKFYERKVIKDILAYLRVVLNPNDSVSLFRIVNVPSRKIGAKTLDTIRKFAMRNNLAMFNAMLLADEIEGISDSKKVAIERFVKIIKDLQKANSDATASGMIKEVLDRTGYKKMIDDGSIEGEARLENISELVSVAHKYDNLPSGMSLNIFLEEVSLISDLDTIDDTDNAVTLMTVHSAKGLEFPHVFIAGLEEGVFPHNRSLMDREELEEERRLMYVAMTRAMDRLYLLHARTRMLYGESKNNAPSQFLSDIDESLVETNFGRHGVLNRLHTSEISRRPVPVEEEKGLMVELSSGDTVRHISFGNGIVINVTGGVVTVAFEDPAIGVKKLALSVAPLKKL